MQHGEPALQTYIGSENSNIQKHLVIRSQMTANTEPSSPVQLEGDASEKVCIAGNIIESLTSTYIDAKKNNTPIVVNCTDGIDRTGITIMALAILKYQDANLDFINKNPQDQQKAILQIYNGLKEDRGAYFLRQERDIARGVTLGFTLIAAKQLMEKRDELLGNLDKESAAYTFLENAKDHSPQSLKILQENFNKLDGTAQKSLKEWRVLLGNRVQAEQQYRISNYENSSFSKKIHATNTEREPKGAGVLLSEAPLATLLSLQENNIDLGVLSDGKKNGYQYAAEQANKNDKQSLIQLGELMHKCGNEGKIAIASHLSKSGKGDLFSSAVKAYEASNQTRAEKIINFTKILMRPILTQIKKNKIKKEEKEKMHEAVSQIFKSLERIKEEITSGNPEKILAGKEKLREAIRTMNRIEAKNMNDSFGVMLRIDIAKKEIKELIHKIPKTTEEKQPFYERPSPTILLSDTARETKPHKQNTSSPQRSHASSTPSRPSQLNASETDSPEPPPPTRPRRNTH